MAQAYTTKRGKNKLAKLGVRRDQQQNQERDLKTSINTIAPKYDGPKVRAFTSAGMISDRSSSTSRLLTDNQPASTGDTNSLGKSTSSSTICSNVGCNAIHDSTTPGSQTKLMDCAACMTVKYCSKACQLMDWSNHKALCKQAKKERLEREILENVFQSTAPPTETS